MKKIFVTIFFLIVLIATYLTFFNNKNKPVEASKQKKISSDSIKFDTPEGRQTWWNSLEDQWKEAFKIGYLDRFSYEYYRSKYEDNNFENYRVWLKDKNYRYKDKNFDSKLFPYDSDLLEIFNMNKFDFFKGDFSNLSGLFYLANVETLITNRNYYLSSTDGICSLEKLKYLDLSRNPIERIDGIENLPELEYADFSFNKINKIPDLTSLVKLEYLNLQYNLITSEDIKNLPKFGTLKYLNLRNNEISSIELKDGFDSLNYLDLSRNNARKINESPVGSGFSMAKIDPIKINIDKKNLKELICEGIGFSSLIEINLNKTLIEYLSVKLNNIKSINGLENINGLQSMNFSYNKIKDISLLENIIGIICLDISNNDLENLSEINKLPNLTHLSIASNQIIDLKGIENLKKIEYLDLSHNHLKDINILEFMTTLKHLNISYNRLEDLKAILNLTDLRHLDLSHNTITDIKGIRRLKKLSYINLSGGSITKIDELLHLANLDTLVIFKSTQPDKFDNQAEIDSIVSKLNLKLYIDNYEDYGYKILKLSGGF
jgi:internalin A